VDNLSEKTKAGVHLTTVLRDAVYSGHDEVVRILLKHAVDNNLQASVNIGSAFMTAMRNLNKNDDGVIRVLLKHIVDERLETSGRIILGAVLYNRHGVVRILMGHGTDLNVRYPSKVKRHDDGVDHFYLGPDLADPTYTSSLLDVAVKQGHQEMIEILVNAGATSDHLPKHGSSTIPPETNTKDDPDRTTST
jgi:ankyrin repeat protein